MYEFFQHYLLRTIMERNHLILLLVLGIIIVLYTFVTLQWVLGIVIAAIIVIAIMIAPPVERWIKTH
jgi:membrane protein YdbS with pleckstrin-like domain